MHSSPLFLTCEMIHVFSMLFCVVRAQHKFDFRFVINEKNSQMATCGLAVVEDHVFDRSTCFLPTSVASVKGLYPRCAGQLHFLDQETAPALSPVTLRICVSALQFHIQENHVSELPITG
jgi:hypothetical protein